MCSAAYENKLSACSFYQQIKINLFKDMPIWLKHRINIGSIFIAFRSLANYNSNDFKNAYML